MADTGTTVTRAPCLPDLTFTLGAVLPVFRRKTLFPLSGSFRKDKQDQGVSLTCRPVSKEACLTLHSPVVTMRTSTRTYTTKHLSICPTSSLVRLPAQTALMTAVRDAEHTAQTAGRNQNSRNEMGGKCGTDGERSGTYRGSVGKSEGKRNLGRRSHRWKVGIIMDLKKQSLWKYNRLFWLRIGKNSWLLLELK